MLTVLIILLFIIVVIVVKTRRKTDSQLHYEEIDMHVIPEDNVSLDHMNSDAEVDNYWYETIGGDSNGATSKVLNRHDKDKANPRPDNAFSDMETYEIIARYERVPHADINLILRQAACENGNMISSNGCDFDCHNLYERAQVYGRITGYEQVPMVDIAQILSYHAHSAVPQHIVTPTTPCSVVPYEQIPLYEQSHNSERTEVLIESLRARRAYATPSENEPFHLYERVQYNESVQQMITGLADKDLIPIENNELYPLYERVKYSETVQQIISILQRSNQSFEIIPEDREFKPAEQYISEVMVYEGQYATYV